MELELREGVGVGGFGAAGAGTITYSKNDGEGKAPAHQYFQMGQAVPLASLAYPRDLFKLDHTFDGWVDSDTGRLYKQGEMVSPETIVRLKAKFTLSEQQEEADENVN